MTAIKADVVNSHTRTLFKHKCIHSFTLQFKVYYDYAAQSGLNKIRMRSLIIRNSIKTQRPDNQVLRRNYRRHQQTITL